MKHKILGYLFVIVAGAAIVSGIYYVQTSKQADTAIDLPAHQSTASNSNVNNPTKSTDTKDSDIETYVNDKYGFQLDYPKGLTGVGELSKNSELGTFDKPVPGYFVGHYVFIPLVGGLKTSGEQNFNNYLNIAVNPPKQEPGMPYVSCKTEKISNPDFAVDYVSCNGEGGPAEYALVKSDGLELFMDGYSSGFQGRPADEQKIDIKKILGSLTLVK